MAKYVRAVAAGMIHTNLNYAVDRGVFSIRAAKAFIFRYTSVRNRSMAVYARTFRGMAMWWFDNKKRSEIWDEAIQWPIGDIEAAHRIREICHSALDSAEKVGAFAGRPDARKHRYEVDRFEQAAKTAMEIAMKISDDLMRDSAVGQIVDLCMTANDTRTARILFRAIHAPAIKDDVLKDHPTLRQ